MTKSLKIAVTVAFSISMVMNCIGLSYCGSPGDSQVLSALASRAVGVILEEEVPLPGRRTHITYISRCRPAPEYSRSIESAVTGAGLSISDSPSGADITLAVTITEARTTFVPSGKKYTRTATVAVHLKCTDPKGTIVFARAHHESTSDTISKKELDTTDNGNSFCGSVSRHVASGGWNVRLFSFLIISAALAYFAFE